MPNRGGKDVCERQVNFSVVLATVPRLSLQTDSKHHQEALTPAVC